MLSVKKNEPHLFYNATNVMVLCNSLLLVGVIMYALYNLALDVEPISIQISCDMLIIVVLPKFASCAISGWTATLSKWRNKLGLLIRKLVRQACESSWRLEHV